MIFPFRDKIVATVFSRNSSTAQCIPRRAGHVDCYHCSGFPVVSFSTKETDHSHKAWTRVLVQLHERKQKCIWKPEVTLFPINRRKKIIVSYYTTNLVALILKSSQFEINANFSFKFDE